MAQLKQNADGSVSIVRERDGLDVFRAGGGAAAGIINIQANGPAVPAFVPGSYLEFNIDGTSATTTGGTLLSWLNNLGYDIIVTSSLLDVILTGTSTATVSFGQAATATGTSSNFLATQSSATVAVVGGAMTSAIKVPQNTWIVGAAAVTGATFSTVRGRLLVEYVPTNSTVGGV